MWALCSDRQTQWDARASGSRIAELRGQVVRNDPDIMIRVAPNSTFSEGDGMVQRVLIRAPDLANDLSKAVTIALLGSALASAAAQGQFTEPVGRDAVQCMRFCSRCPNVIVLCIPAG